MPHEQKYILRKIYPNVPDRIFLCTADLYRSYSCRRFLLSETPKRNSPELTEFQSEQQELTKLESDETVSETYGPDRINEDKVSPLPSSREISEDVREKEYTPKPHQRNSKDQSRRSSIMPTFVLSSASPEPTSHAFNENSLKDRRISIIQRETSRRSSQKSLTTLSAKSSPSSSRNSSPSRGYSEATSMAGGTDISLNVQNNKEIPGTRFTSELNATVVDTMKYSKLTKISMEFDDLTIAHKYQVLTLLVKARIRESIFLIS